MLIGHEKIWDFLVSALDRQALSHALCFIGPDQVGKRTLARMLAGRALKTETEKLFTHPDFLYIEREEDEKKGRLKKDISVAQAKTVGAFMRNRSWLGGRKVVMIDEAEVINNEAANALLKTLEESEGDALMILLAVDDKMLPATVRSRCQLIEFFPIASEVIMSGLKNLGYDENLSAEATRFSYGRPGRAIALAGDIEALEGERAEAERFEKIINKPFHVKLKEAESLFGDKDDATRGRDNLKKTIDRWMMICRTALRGERLSESTLNRQTAFELITAMSEARRQLGENLHPRLLMERIFLKMT